MLAKPVTDKAPLLLRVASTRPANDPARTRYDLRFMGLVPGTHDLKDFLVRADGSSAADLPGIPVAVGGLLPPDHQGQLEREYSVRWPFFGGYRGLMAGLLVLWLALLVPLIRMGRKHRLATAQPPPPAPPTFADRLRPLIDQAARGELSADDEGRLERMLLGYWRRRLELQDETSGGAIAELRRHREAGALLRALEQWLHRPPGAQVEPAEVGKLLEPYRNVPDPTDPEPPAAAAAAAAAASGSPAAALTTAEGAR